MILWTRKVLWCFFYIFVTCDARTINKELEVNADLEKSPFELNEFLNGTFYVKSWNGTWLSDSAFLFKNEEGDILKYDLEKKSSELFLESHVLDNYPDATITLSTDQSFVLIRYSVSSVFRHSTTALYTIYDIVNQQYYDIANSVPIQLATFAPIGHGLAYVFENNIYYLEDFAIDVNNPVAVTTVGEIGVIYCGVPDWVYEEEVFGGGSALWFSPDATHIAFATFYDENVEEFSYYIYGEPGSLDTLYPHEARIKYPKVGTPNPIVSSYVYNIATKETVEFQLPESINNKDPNDYVLYDLTWISNTEVSMISTNRIQNQVILLRCTIDGPCSEEESYSEENGWIEPIIPKYSKDGKKRLEILAQPEGEDTFFHLVLTDIESGNKTRLTYGNRVVTEIYGWDEERGLIYYSGSVNDTPSQQQVYVVSTSGENECLTCDLEVDGEKCQYAAASFSTSLSYHVKACTGPNPTMILVEKTQDKNDVTVWEDNALARSNLAYKSRPVIKDLKVPINEEFTARVRLLLPPGLDESSTKKYPAIVHVYGGPNSNQIADAFSSGFQNYIVTNREYIYIYIDGRGSGRDGLKKMFQIYRNLGTVEIEDQIAVTKYLQENLPYIDADRTGIWGWSYGGFASTWALIKDTQNVFKFALAVAPVTSFIYYDTIYTERYMGLPIPGDNELGYNNTDVTRNVEAIRGKRYFIIHGNADDNVHYQNSMLMVKALEQADIDFRQQSYPDENHSLSHVYPHLYHTIDKFWATCFDIEEASVNSWHQKENTLN